MKIVVATILIIGTLVGISALVSAVYKTNKAVPHASSVWHQHEELTLRAIYVSIARFWRARRYTQRASARDALNRPGAPLAYAAT